MISYTVGELITRSLRLIGILAEGETASAETYSDALLVLNQMLDSWNTERLCIFSTKDQVFDWPPMAASQKLGPSGDMVGERPVLLDESTYFVYNGISYGIRFINQMQYDNIAVKTVTSTYPQAIFINYSFPDIEMFVYPVPNSVTRWHFISVDELSVVPSISSTVSLPPGYLKAIVYNLACELSLEFGLSPSPEVLRHAGSSRRNIKSINISRDMMMIPYGIPVGKRYFNIYTGGYS